MPLREPFVLRHFAPDVDIARLVDLLAAVEAHDQEGQVTDEAIVREQLAAPDHDPIKDRWVVHTTNDPNSLIGFCALWKPVVDSHADAQLVVHPDWRRRGLASELLHQMVARAQEKDATHVVLYTDMRNQAGHAFLLHHGLVAAGTYTEMRAPAHVQIAEPVWPVGYTLRSYNMVQDVSTLTEAFNRSYQGLWGHHVMSFEQIERWLPELSLDGLLVLFAADNTLAGVCRVEHSTQRSAANGRRTGYIDAPGIVPELRDQGLYVPLLSAAMRWLGDQDCSVIELESWGDDPATITLYRTIGFETLRQERSYFLDMQPQA